MSENNSHRWSTAIILIAIAALLNSLSQVFWKMGDIHSPRGVILFIIGLLVSGAGMLFMMVSFRFGEVSILQPMMSIGFAFSIVFGYFFFSEAITLTKLVGTIIIIIGATLLNTEGKKGEKS